jgi:valacyclovir hydrolase
MNHYVIMRPSCQQHPPYEGEYAVSALIPLPTGATLHVEDVNPQAEGIPIIAVHGMLGTARLHLGHVIDWLAEQGYRVIAPTVRGYGESLPKPRDFPLRFYDRDADDIMALADALNIEKAHIIGYSDGGEIALICAGKQSERFVSVAVWGAVGYFGQGMRAIAQRMIPGSRWLKADEMATHGLTDADLFAQQWVRATVHMIDAGGDVSLSLAPNIKGRTLIMLGEEDTLNPAEYAQRFLDATHDGHLAMFDCGHPVHDERTKAFRNTLQAHFKAIT